MKKIGDISQFPIGQCKVVEIDGKKISIYNINGKIFASDAECTHMKGPLCKGRIIVNEGKPYVQCPWHGAVFNLETGEAMSGPTKNPLKIYTVKIKENEVYIEI